jgi:hypothetical protein
MARYLVTATLLFGLLTSSGCCWWAERWCPHAQPVAVQAYPAGCQPAACGCPTTNYTPPPNWVQPQPPVPVQQACPCTCP